MPISLLRLPRGSALPSSSSRQLTSCFLMNSAAAFAAEARSPGLSDDSSPRIRSSRLRSFCWIFSSSFRQIFLHPVARLLDRLAAAGIGEADKARSVHAVEVDARARGNPCFAQHALAEFERVIGEPTGIGIGVDRAVALVDTEAERAQSRRDQRPVGDEESQQNHRKDALAQ